MYITHWKLALIATGIAPFSWYLIRLTGKVVGHYSTVQVIVLFSLQQCAGDCCDVVRELCPLLSMSRIDARSVRADSICLAFAECDQQHPLPS